MLCKLFNDIAACLKNPAYICESFNTHNYRFNSIIYSKKIHMYGLLDITIFLVISSPYRYIGSFDITIPRYNDIILILNWHIVRSGFHCIEKLPGVILSLYKFVQFLKGLCHEDVAVVDQICASVITEL